MRRYRVVNTQDKALSLRKLPGEDQDVALRIPGSASGLELLDCKHVDDDRYKWCDVVLGKERGWVNQYYLAPVARD